MAVTWEHLARDAEPHLRECMWDVLIAETQEEADIAMSILMRAARGEEGPGMNNPETVDEMKALHESMGGRRPKD